jgi:hypothetical protein
MTQKTLELKKTRKPTRNRKKSKNQPQKNQKRKEKTLNQKPEKVPPNLRIKRLKAGFSLFFVHIFILFSAFFPLILYSFFPLLRGI